MPESKYCPVCHAINPGTAERCECGYRFRGDDNITDRDVAAAERRHKLRRAAEGVIVAAVIAVLVLLTVFAGIKVLLYVIAGLVAAIVVTLIVLKVIGVLDRKKNKNK